MFARVLYFDRKRCGDAYWWAAQSGRFTSADYYRDVGYKDDCWDWANPQDVCDRVFVRFNTAGAHTASRSMSCGDVVVRVDADGRCLAAWICAAVGFDPVDPECFQGLLDEVAR